MAKTRTTKKEQSISSKIKKGKTTTTRKIELPVDLESFPKSQKLPTIVTAISMEKYPAIENAYEVAIYKIQGDRVVSRESFAKPNLKRIAEVNFKKAAVFNILESSLKR